MTHQQRSDQEWREILQHYESSQLIQREFCRQNQLNLSTFFSKQRSLRPAGDNQQSGFFGAEVVQQNPRYRMINSVVTNMTLSPGDIVN